MNAADYVFSANNRGSIPEMRFSIDSRSRKLVDDLRALATEIETGMRSVEKVETSETVGIEDFPSSALLIVSHHISARPTYHGHQAVTRPNDEAQNV